MELYRAYCDYDGNIYIHGPYKITKRTKNYIDGTAEKEKIHVPADRTGIPRSFTKTPYGACLIVDIMCGNGTEAAKKATEAFSAVFCTVNMEPVQKEDNREGICICSCRASRMVTVDGPYEVIKEEKLRFFMPEGKRRPECFCEKG